mmetsp:Transcript_13709/g.38974  ORF Transcript_13709/g.38974 Transcript_13709/m.38974 type:complete len:225 (-) Transcript_13709:1834-2508(-)
MPSRRPSRSSTMTWSCIWLSSLLAPCSCFSSTSPVSRCLSLSSSSTISPILSSSAATLMSHFWFSACSTMISWLSSVERPSMCSLMRDFSRFSSSSIVSLSVSVSSCSCCSSFTSLVIRILCALCLLNLTTASWSSSLIRLMSALPFMSCARMRRPFRSTSTCCRSAALSLSALAASLLAISSRLWRSLRRDLVASISSSALASFSSVRWRLCTSSASCSCRDL